MREPQSFGGLASADDYRCFLEERRRQILARVEAAAREAGRDPQGVEVLAVSKTVGTAELACAWQAGWRSFAENRPQELKRKTEAAAQDPQMADARFDLIGNLQKNKINQVLSVGPTLIHSVSSLHLAEALSKRAEAKDLGVKVLLEVNVSQEASKSGFSADEVKDQVEQVVSLPALSVCGLMTMAPAGDPQAARATFSGLRELAEDLRSRTGLALPTLSCGMSDDYEIAVREGSTVLRLGRIVFDPAYALN